MLIFASVDMEQVQEARNRLIDFADGMDKAFNESFEESVVGTSRRSQREIQTLVAIERSNDGYIQAIPGLAESYLGREGNVKLLDRSIPLRAFKATQTAEGVVVQLTRANISSVFYKSAFGVKIPKLNGHIYRRAGKARLPIVKIVNLKVSKIEGVEPTFKAEVAKYKATMINKLESRKKQLIQQYGKDVVYVTSQT